MGKLFGTDGIRGIANTYPMDVETAAAVGKAIVHFFSESSDGSGKHVLIGQDTRSSGDMLAQAVAAGACAAGADVWMLGVLPTPGVAHLARTAHAMAAIIISASHNPYEDNGIKVFNADGYKLSDDAESAIEALIIEAGKIPKAGSRDIGRVKMVSDAKDRYLAFLQKASKLKSLSHLSLILDCANGATSQVAPELFGQLRTHALATFCSPNGFNINDQCGSQYPKKLAQAVVSQKADAGLAFDGDGDRLIAVDETGHILTGDQIMAICAKDMLEKDLLKDNVVVSTVMSNMGLGLALNKLGITLHMTQVGDRNVMEKMRREGAVLGGEDSGHLIFRDVHTTGDGLVAAIKLLEAMCSSGKPLSELSRVMTVFPQELINVDVKMKPEIESIPEIMQAIAAIEKSLDGRGRVLVRYSGTQNKCRIMVEGPTPELTHASCVQLADAVRRVIGV
ncbi:MAG: phosphoglucosamine mutase [Desulfobacteraceae bacterium]|nr:MAG: phosphoglucosamine mutase [Desulfobacteraceae bacterium]